MNSFILNYLNKHFASPSGIKVNGNTSANLSITGLTVRFRTG
jgi:hypothetical protein